VASFLHLQGRIGLLGFHARNEKRSLSDMSKSMPSCIQTPIGKPLPPDPVSKKKRASQRKPKPVIGWREWVALPDLGVEKIKVKVDTGARTSALHAIDLHHFEEEGRKMVRFKVHPYQRDFHRTVESVAEVVDMRNVRNSGGQAEWRPVIHTHIELMGQNWPIEITLTNRDVMGFRMLLGRQAVRRHFLIDPGRSSLSSK
jgi:hypothetical protein